MVSYLPLLLYIRYSALGDLLKSCISTQVGHQTLTVQGVIMKTKLAIALAALLSTSAMAHDHGHHNQNSCNVSLEHSVKVTPAFIQVLDGDKSLFRITDNSELYAQGKRIHLTAEQQQIIDDYRD